MSYEPILLERLLDRAARDTYRGHMPGHKGKPVLPEHIERIDFTELSDTGNLYDPDPQNIIRQAESRAAEELGVPDCVFSAGGSTLLIQAALYAVTENAKCSTWNISRPPKILAARDSHRSFFSACALLGCSVDFLYPEYSPDGIAVGVPPDALRAALRAENYDAVYLTAPNYYGSFCRADALADVCSELGTPLIVDAAHAAGLVCGSKCSTWNISNPAPNFVAIFSAHKTLEALGGAAFALSSGGFFAKEKLLRGMQLFGSSSPSYAILASLDLALSRALSDEGRATLDRTVDRAEALRRKLSTVDGVSIPSFIPANFTQNVPRGTRAEGLTSTQPAHSDCSAQNSSLRGHAELPAISLRETGQSSGLCAHPNYSASDPCRLTLRFTHARGETAAEWLERERGVAAEMADDRFVVFILTAADTDEDFERLEQAIVACAAHCHGSAGHAGTEITCPLTKSLPNERGSSSAIVASGVISAACLPHRFPIPIRVTSMRDALFSPTETVPLADALDRVSAEILAPYPPGVPVVAPGEKITQKTLSFLNTKWYNMNRMVRVLRAEAQTKEDLHR